MPDRPGGEHEERYTELRRRVLELRREAADQLGEGSGGEPGPEPGPEPDAAEGAGGTLRVHGTLGLDDALDAGELATPGEVEVLHERLLATVEELTGATDAFLTFEDRLPVLRDVPARAWSVQIVRASALAMLLGGVLLALGIWRGILGVPWLPVLLVTLPAAARMAFMPVAPAAGRHRRQRWSALAGGAAALLLAPVAAVFGWLPGLACVAALAGALAVLFERRVAR